MKFKSCSEKNDMNNSFNNNPTVLRNVWAICLGVVGNHNFGYGLASALIIDDELFQSDAVVFSLLLLFLLSYRGESAELDAFVWSATCDLAARRRFGVDCDG